MTIIKYEKWNSEYCLEKVFDIIFEDYNNDILTISCNIFQKKHFIIIYRLFFYKMYFGQAGIIFFTLLFRSDTPVKI